MRTVLDVVKFVLPDGSLPNGSLDAPEPGNGGAVSVSASWLNVCIWPADLFAVAATIASRCGFYAAGAFSAPWAPVNVCGESYRKAVMDAGKQWRSSGEPPKLARDLWGSL